ncbi:MAG TPA: aminodeoxychorismate synthase component I [Terracidiphilus sp.]|nr:aminodeoxychorismate synthase component I [Terracidiphilus sp.]
MTRRSALPAEIYALVNERPATVLLEGAQKAKYQPDEVPWTQLFTAPLHVCEARSAADLPELFGAIEAALGAGRCAAGFFTYECGAWFEPAVAAVKGEERSSCAGALAWFGIYEHGYRIDGETGQFIDELPGEIEARLDVLRAQIAAPELDENLPSGSRIEAEYTIGEEDYSRRIAAIHEWIRAGDVYQLNFTAPWRVSVRGSAAELYARLRRRQPARYGAFVHAEPGHRILSFSPELFFNIDTSAGGGRRITTRPMKGTVRRGRTTGEDRERAEWLKADPKNRSENVMIVDLVRNDLGRVAKFGTVRAEKLFHVERYPTLWQMTSTVAAELCDDAGVAAVFRALFPCGSVTGAPKVRAMQLIAELESAARGVYTGAIGFFSPKRTVFNVAIRTLELHGGGGTMGTGSGVVIDSVAADEYRESLLKAEFLTAALADASEEFALIETMRWENGFPLLELHLDRLTDSAEYFDFSADRDEVRVALENYARQFAAGSAQRVRLLLDGDGGVQITHQLLAPVDQNRMRRVSISPHRTDPADAMLFHKTTHRELYARAFEQAQSEGFDDVLFFNLRGELTEGAISNVFVEKDGKLLTPPIECGLLAGVYRRHLLETRPNVEERILNEEDLRSADAVYLANAVRGLQRAKVEFDFAV